MKTLLTLWVSSIMFLTNCNGHAIHFSDQSFKSSDSGSSFVQNYTLASPATLKISTSGGNISTTGHDSNVAEVTFIVKKRNQVLDITLDDLKKLADVEIIQSGNSLEINVKKTYEKNLSVGFSIKTPLSSSCSLNTSGGNISLSGVTGTQNVNTSGGNVDMEKINGSAKANTSGGNISLNNSKADFNATTSGGNISLNSIEGSLQVSTSGGNIDASNTKSGLTAQTSGGNIGIKNADGPMDVNTSGGSIDLDGVTGSVKAITSGGDISANISKLSDKLYLETSGGSIRATVPSGLGLDLDLTADHINTPLTNFTGSAKKDRIKGQMNGGGIPVHLSTSGGSISLNYK